MHWFVRLSTAIILTLISIILLFSIGLTYLIVTPLGGKILVRYFKQGFSSVGLMHVGHYEGSHYRMVLPQGCRVSEDYLIFPEAVLRIQEIKGASSIVGFAPILDFGIFLMPRIKVSSIVNPIVFTGRVWPCGSVKGTSLC